MKKIALFLLLAEPSLAGLEVVSHSAQMLNLSEFDQVKVEPGGVE